MFTCYIIDDEQFSINSLIEDIEKMPTIKLIGQNTNPIRALEEIQQNFKPDIVFLDVEMPKLSGIDVAKLLPQGIAIIIRTSFSKHAQNAFDIDAVDFLYKPHNFDRFVKAVMKAQHFLLKSHSNRQTSVPKSIFINSNVKGKVNHIVISEVIYIEALGHNITIHTTSEVFTTRLSLKDIEEQLPMENFARVHRAFILNINFIKSVDGNGITMTTNVIIPFGDLYKQAFRDKMKSRTINKSS